MWSFVVTHTLGKRRRSFRTSDGANLAEVKRNAEVCGYREVEVRPATKTDNTLPYVHTIGEEDY